MKIIKGNGLKILVLVFAAISFSSCQKKGSNVNDDLDLVFTNYDQKFDFKAKSTYSLPNSVVLVNGSDFDEENSFAKPAYANTILSNIRSNMNDFGWTEVDQSASPDIILFPTVNQTTNVDYYYSYRYWDWYLLDSYYPGGWGWYYPGYYEPVVATTSYKTGSLLLQMTDPSGKANSDQLPVVWTCIVNGLLEGNTQSIQARITKSLNQAFYQSRYLNH